MDATIIIAIVPVVLLVAYIVWLVRAKITEGRDIDLREPITGVVICLVAVLIIGSMTASTVTYTYSEDTNTLYINQNLIDSRQPFDSYGDEIKSVVIGNNCRVIETGTLDSLTSLEYVSIGENVDVRQGAFGVAFQDPFGSAIDPEPGYYAGFGDGTLYHADLSILAISGENITGLASSASNAKYVVIPPSGQYTTIGSSAFSGTGIEKVIALPESIEGIAPSAFSGCVDLTQARFPAISAMGGSIFYGCVALASVEFEDMPDGINSNVFYNCTSLSSFEFPDGVKTIATSAFSGCTSLTSLRLPAALEILGNSALSDCTSLEVIELPSRLTQINNLCFSGCSSLEAIAIPDSVTTIGGNAFRLCSGIKEVSFGTGLSSIQSNSFSAWTFYGTDGVTQIDSSVASNLVGKTFMGTASALVEVAPGMLSLTPQQLQQVQLHTQELQQQELDIQPLPFQPTVQTQDQGPVAA